GTASATWTAPSGSTERYEVATTGTLSSEISDMQQSGTGATGAKTATVNCSAGTVGVTQTVALRGRSTTCPAIRYRSGTANTTARSAQGGAPFIRTSTRAIAPAGAIAPTSTDTNSSKNWVVHNIALRPSVAGASPVNLPVANNWTCTFSSDQMSSLQQMQAGTV